MQPEKKSKLDMSIIDNSDGNNLSSPPSTTVEGTNSHLFGSNVFSSFWQVTLTKIQVLINNHRLSIRTSRLSNPLKFTTVLSLLPFVVGFSYFFSKKYPGPLTNYFFEKNIPGLSIPSEKLNWETVQYLLKPNLKQNTFDRVNLQSFCQENSIILNQNIFDESLQQKIFINRFQKRPASVKNQKNLQRQVNREKFILISNVSQYSTFQTLDDLPFYLESFSNFSDFSFSPSTLVEGQPAGFLGNIKGHQKTLNLIEELPKKENVVPLLQVEGKGKTVSTKVEVKQTNLTKNIFSDKILQERLLLNNRQNLIGIQTSNKNILKSFQPKSLDKKLEKLLEINPFLKKQKEFENFWQLFQSEIQNVFLEKNLLFSFQNLSKNKTKLNRNIKLLQRLKDFSILEEKTLFEEILFSSAQLGLIENPFQNRLMSGYRYPDMPSREINQVALQQKMTSGPSLFNEGKEANFLQIKIPSTLVETRQYAFQLNPLPEFSISINPSTFKDLEKNKILYEGPGVILDKDTSFDWKTELKNNLFEFTSETAQFDEVWNRFLSLPNLEKFHLEKKQGKKNLPLVFETLTHSKKTNLRIWLQRYLSAYTPFSNSTKNFFGIQESPEFSSSFSESIGTRKFPVYQLQTCDDQGKPIGSGFINLNQSIFQVEHELQLPFLSMADWTNYYQNLKLASSVENSEPNFLTLPLLQPRFPKISSSLSPTKSQIGLYDNLDYQFNTKLLNLGNSSNASFLNTNVKIQGILENENFETLFDAGFYNKLPSIFSLKDGSAISFQDNWEPLSFQSWLIISQIGFAFSVFQILKALADQYGRELLVYLLDLVAILGVVDEEIKQQIEILLGNREKGFRIIANSRKNFSDIAGVKKLLPELAEIVWFLRNCGRDFSISKTLPRGILLIGPPGTGKTLLVQALAGEANVPVLALSGGSLVEPGESGALKLEFLFQEARRLAPCIVFIDEMDTLAQKREQVMQHPMGADGILEILTNPVESGELRTQFENSPTSLAHSGFSQSQDSIEPFSSLTSAQNLETQVTIQAQAKQQLQKEQLRLLMQLLVELDGIQGRDGVIVIGATNRPETLDAAILRPGRFDRILELGLPGYQKRIDILKLYSQQLGYDKSISWNYFAERTNGFTAADLASIINVSSLKAILSNTAHTLESIEYGIDRIMTSESQKTFKRKFQEKNSTIIESLVKRESLKNTNQLESEVISPSQLSENQRLAYYQAGKIICTSLLPSHPPVLIAQLWNRRTNLRALKIAANLQNYFLRFATRREVEQRIIASYSGKVGEILYLQKLSSFESAVSWNQLFNVNISTLGLDDLSFGQVLVNFLIEKWYLYSIQPILQKLTEVPENRNFQELSEEKIEFLDVICQYSESSPRPIGQFLPGPFEDSEDEEKTSLEMQNIATQHKFSIPWWQQQISAQLESVERSFDFPAWYRIYIPNPQETELNPYWLPPDEFYHRNTINETLSTEILRDNWQDSPSFWNDVGRNSQDYQVHSLVLQSFNKAFVLVEQHRELLDALASKLLTQKVLRQWDIAELFQRHNVEYTSQQENESSSLSSTLVEGQEVELMFSNTPKISIQSNWGFTSRRKKSKWIDFERLKTES